MNIIVVLACGFAASIFCYGIAAFCFDLAFMLIFAGCGMMSGSMLLVVSILKWTGKLV